MKKKLLSILMFTSRLSLIVFAIHLISANLLFAYEASAQMNVRIHANSSNITVRQIFDAIESKTALNFIYDSNNVDVTKIISLNEDLTVKEIIDQLETDLDFVFRPIKNTITVVKAGPQHLTYIRVPRFDFETLLQQTQITGTVTDLKGETLPGVSVRIDGTTLGTTTDVDGRYSLDASGGNTLVFTYIGFITQEVSINNRTSVNVTLIEDTQNLEEVVIVGYGTQKASVVSSAISSVTSEELNLGNPTNIQNALKGKAAGVQITMGSGQPGSSSQVRIRGVGTVNNSSPLFIVDGMPTSGGIDDINPNDIESIDVLKDAASAAIYGARGANGVILVTTKKGRAGTPSLNYDVSYGLQNTSKKLDLMDAKEYETIINEMRTNEGKTPVYASPSNVINTNWQEELFEKNAPIVNHRLSINGGNDKSIYYLSFGYVNQDGIVASDYSNYERYNARFNNSYTLIDAKDRNWLNNVKVNSIISYSKSTSRGIANNNELGGVISSMTMLPPNEYVFEDDPAEIARYDVSYPNYVKSPDGRVYKIIELRELGNPYAVMQSENNRRTINQKFGANFNVDAEIFEGLKFKSSAGLDWGFTGLRGYTPAFYIATAKQNALSSVQDSKAENYNWQWENILTYDKTIDEHSISALVGTSLSEFNFENLYGSSYEMLTTDPNKAYIDYTIGDKSSQRINGSASQHRIASTFARLNYNFSERYMIEGIVRRDGSSNFSANNKYAIFPSVSAAWTPTNESFMEGRPEWFDFLKIRASWGQNGNENIGAFRYVSMMSVGNNIALGKGNENEQILTGISPSYLANADLKWETSEQSNIGLDLRLFQSLRLTVDYFKKQTKDMLLNVGIPNYTGFGSILSNAGTMHNEGVEFDISYPVKINEVELSFGANASYLTTNVTDMGPGRVGLSSFNGGGTVAYAETGQPFGYFYGYVHDGIFQNINEVNAYKRPDGTLNQPLAKPGDIRFKDVDGNGILDDNDRTLIGDPNPDWTFGFRLNARWKNFDFATFIQGVYGNEIYNANRRTNVPNANWDRKWLNRWTGEGTSDYWPRILENDVNQNTSRISSLLVEDGSYVRLKTIQLGYQIPEHLTKRLSVNRLRVYFMVDNLLTFTNYTGYDPEIGNKYGLDVGNYPQAKTFNFGVNITL